MFKSIGSKIIAVVVLGLLVTNGVSAFQFMRSNKNTVLTTLGETLPIVASEASTKIVLLLDNVMTLAKILALDELMVNPNSNLADQVKYLQGVQASTGYQAVAMTDAEGNAVNHLGNSFSIADRGYFQRVKSTLQPAISDMVISRTSGARSIVLAYPRMNNGIFCGVIYITIYYEMINSIVNSLDLGKNSIALMIDRKGTIISHPDAEVINKNTNISSLAGDSEDLKEVARDMIAGHTASDFYMLNGQEVFIAFNPVSSSDWSLALQVNVEDYLHSYYEEIKLFLLYMSIIMVVSIGISIVVTNSISRPIKRITLSMFETLKILAGKDYDELRTRNEVKLLEGVSKARDEVVQTYISEISHVLELVAAGDLRYQVNGYFGGVYVPIKKSLNEAVLSQNEMIKVIAKDAGSLNTISNEFILASQTLSKGTTDQAASVEQLSTTVTEISKQVRQNASNSDQANELTEKTKLHVEEGNFKMKKMLESMEEIEKSSSEISNIISVIEDIADQTNLLALNAAIEAARAGEAGRGFAVVADEVRKLAEKSAKATQQISELITMSVENTKNGAIIADEVATSLDEIVKSVEDVASLITEINTATRHESVALDQVSVGINVIAEVTNSNSSTAQESAASASELAEQAHSLEVLVSKFKV